MKKYWYWDDQHVSSQILHYLQKEEVIAGTSDTVIGLLAPLTQQGKRALDRVKKRVEKPYIILVHDLNKAALFAPAIKHARLQPLLTACWPGPLTIIFAADVSLPDYVKSSTGTIALRIPDHLGLQKILQSVDGLFSTSANITGEKIPKTIDQLAPTIVNEVALIIDDREKKISKPSTIIDATGPDIRLIREGSYPREIIEQYITLT